MQTAFNILIFIAMASVLVVLGWGLVNMFRGGDGNLSQKLMRARVILQLVAIALIMIAFAIFSPNG